MFAQIKQTPEEHPPNRGEGDGNRSKRGQREARLTSTVLLQGVPVVPSPAQLAVLPLRVVEAPEAPPRLLVAGFRVCRVDVVVTEARLTGAPHVRGIAKEAGGTVVTPGA